MDEFLQPAVVMLNGLRSCLALSVTILAVECAHPLLGDHGDGAKMITAAQRAALIRRAQVWRRVDVASIDLKAGPQGKDAFPPGATVTCDYVEEAFGGNTPKFGCSIGPQQRVKVRYGRTNGEVYAGVAATRLLWALGFGADAVYPVHVVCRGCPRTLASDGVTPDGSAQFDVAAIERKMPGREVEAPSVGAGWSWSELDQVDERAGGAPLAHRDALKLLAVFLQHTDSKPEQQKLLCLSDKADGGEGSCAVPFMMVHDVGQTFGGANLFNRGSIGSVNFEQWSRARVWKDPARCIGNLTVSQTGTLNDPVISEAGRRFLLDELTQLSDEQLRDLFTVARFADKPHGAPVDAWVAAFKQKRDEIAGVRCY